MCGIFGIQTSKKKLDIKHICTLAEKSLSHRGPDDGNIWHNSSTGLVHRRLSIIDVKNGIQPMHSENRRYVITYNGEIVNFKYLQSKFLFNKKLKTSSDTEVLIELYDKLGVKVLDHIKGMFSFCIYDKLLDNFFLARDHIGIKPLYYYKDKNLFCFSSEISVLYKSKIKNFHIDESKLNEFLVHGSIYGKSTLHNKVKELEPGYYLIGSQKNLKCNKYWDVTKFSKTKNTNFQTTSKQLEKNLKEIVEEWCTSDVKIGSLLSGGLDSTFISTIAASLRKVDMFTNYFPDRKKEFNELPLAAIVAKATRSKHYRVKVKDNFSNDNIKKLVDHLCDPIQDLNSLSFMALCKFIKSNTNIKVILTGEGSDELFAGYDRHFQIANVFEKSKKYNDILFSMNYLSANRLKIFLNTKFNLSKDRIKIFKDSKLLKHDPLKKVLLHDQKTFLPGYLDRVDKISMMYGLEVRTPFLDERFISLANQCKSSFKVKIVENKIIKKFILRKIFQKYVSKKIVWNKNKYQFNYPTAASFKNGALNVMYKDLINKNSKIANIFEPNNLNNLLKHHESGFADHSNLLARLLTFELFARIKY